LPCGAMELRLGIGLLVSLQTNHQRGRHESQASDKPPERGRRKALSGLANVDRQASTADDGAQRTVIDAEIAPSQLS
jgi:hypothetical protein